MKRKLDLLIRYFNRQSEHEKSTVLYQHRKIELSFYLNEMSLCKFILERQQNTRADEKYFTKKHIKARTNCFLAIQDISEFICGLELSTSENVQGYMDECNRLSTLNVSRGFQYHLNSN